MCQEDLYTSHLHIMALINALSGHENHGKHVTGESDKSGAEISRTIFSLSRKSCVRTPHLKQLRHVNLLHLNHYWQLVCVRRLQLAPITGKILDI